MSAHIPPLHHIIDGPDDAPAVVLIHAIATTSDLWWPQVPAWKEKFRLVRVDLPGHGATPPWPSGSTSTVADYADAIIALLDRLAIGRAAVVGISLGGMVAQALALGHPHRIGALVLAQTSAQTPLPLREVWQQRIDDFHRQGWQAQLPATLERWFTPTFLASAPMTMDWIAGLICSTSAKGYCDAIGAIQQLAHLDRLGEIDIPVLVIAGAADKAVTPETARAMAAQLRHADLVILPEAAHMANIEQPIRFTEMVGDFLTRVPIGP